MGADEDVDDMVWELMCRTNDYSRSTRMNVPDPADVTAWIVARTSGRDDWQLLEAFQSLRAEYVLAPIEHPWCSPRGREHPDLADVSGEIDYPTPCPECGHDVLWHHEDGGWTNCEHGMTPDGGLPCNCGNNIGR